MNARLPDPASFGRPVVGFWKSGVLELTLATFPTVELGGGVPRRYPPRGEPVFGLTLRTAEFATAVTVYVREEPGVMVPTSSAVVPSAWQLLESGVGKLGPQIVAVNAGELFGLGATPALTSSVIVTWRASERPDAALIVMEYVTLFFVVSEFA